MRKLVSTSLIAILLAALGASQCQVPLPPPDPGPPAPGRILVDPAKTLGEISPFIYGLGVEWTDHGNNLAVPETGRLREDMLALLQNLRVPVIRFPGGIFADYYRWQDGIGPLSERPVGKSPTDGTEHPNTFGTGEFVELCRALGSEALITANYGTGTVQDAVAWKQHFESLRFPARYWEVGNEIYLAEPKFPGSIPGNDERIYHTSKEYAASFGEWAGALRNSGGEVLVGAIMGTRNTSAANRDWSPVVLPVARQAADFVALHNSFAPLIFGSYNFKDRRKLHDAYRAMFAQADASAEDTRAVKRELGAARQVRIAVTEHFPLFGGGGDHDQLLAILDQSKTLGSALYTASLFHSFMREGVWMANYNLVVGKWFGALVTDTDQGLVRTPTYHVYDLYRNHFGTTLLETVVESPTYASPAVGTVAARPAVRYLDAVASRGPAGEIFLAVVNRHLTHPIAAPITVRGHDEPALIEVRTLTGPEVHSINGPGLGPTVLSGALDAMKAVTSSWRYTAGLDYSFPPRSVTILEWKAAP